MKYSQDNRPSGKAGRPLPTYNHPLNKKGINPGIYGYACECARSGVDPNACLDEILRVWTAAWAKGSTHRPPEPTEVPQHSDLFTPVVDHVLLLLVESVRRIDGPGVGQGPGKALPASSADGPES